MEEKRIYETPELSLCDTAIERGFAASMDTSTEEITPEKRWIGNLKNTAMRKKSYIYSPSLHFSSPASPTVYKRNFRPRRGSTAFVCSTLPFRNGRGHASSESGVPTAFSPNGNPPTGSASSPATKRRRPFSPSRNLTVRTPYSKARRLRTQPPISLSILTASCWDARERPSRGR